MLVCFYRLLLMSCVVWLFADSSHAKTVHEEKNGIVAIEMESTDSPLGNWMLIQANAQGYPGGAVGKGHLEYQGPWSGQKPVDPLEYHFKINKPGRYYLMFRAHKRLLGNPGDKNNDCFVRMEGDFVSGSNEIPLDVLQTDTKLFGGAPESWGQARRLDKKKKAHLKDAVYEFKAGETYTLVVSGRSTRFNLDRLVLFHEKHEVKLRDLQTLPESASTKVETASDDSASSGEIEVLGDRHPWHKVTLALDGPTTSEDATPNPFTDYRMDVTFTHAESGKTLTVPGFFAADGDAANSSATSGSTWHCHFRPSEPGVWEYQVSFREGKMVATSTKRNPGKAVAPYDGLTGSFEINADNPATAPDLRADGRLRYVGKHHLQFEGSGRYFLKYGPDSPENFLEYDEFDNTPAKGHKGIRHPFTAHAKHYQGDGQTWQNGKGKNILGVINYLETTRANSISMVLNNIGRLVPDPKNEKRPLSGPGDGDRAFPYTSKQERLRFDCSKLDQWEIVFDHAEQKGLHLHFKLAEIENARDLDFGNGGIGDERKTYYREMVARFGHHLALNWNISEEIPVGAGTRKAWLNYLETIDPWQNHRVFHTGPSKDKSNFYKPHLGESSLTGISLQTPEATSTQNVFNETKLWIDRSAAKGHPWVVACDEQGPGNKGVNAGFDLSRKYVLWGNIMAGGGGAEYYSGGSDLKLDDYAHFDELLTWSGYAVHDFFYAHDIPFWDMHNDDALIDNKLGHCLINGSDTLVVYLTEGGDAALLDLSAYAGTFDVKWFDPRNGGDLQDGSVTTLTGGEKTSLGKAPSKADQDWAILITAK